MLEGSPCFSITVLVVSADASPYPNEEVKGTGCRSCRNFNSPGLYLRSSLILQSLLQ